MFTLLISLIVLFSVLLIILILVQNPKGGGLSSSFGGGGAQSMGGVQNTNNFLDRSTWTLAISMFALILLANFAIPRATNTNPQLENTLENVNTTTPTNTSAPVTTNDSI